MLQQFLLIKSSKNYESYKLMLNITLVIFPLTEIKPSNSWRIQNILSIKFIRSLLASKSSEHISPSTNIRNKFFGYLLIVDVVLYRFMDIV